MKEQKKEFTGVWIPKHIIEDESLSMTDRMVYAEIACFEVCYKSNESLGERYKLKKNTISIIISKLIKKDYVKSNQKTGNYRRLSANRDKPNQRGCMIKIKEPLSEKSKSLCDKNHTIDNSIENKKDILSATADEIYNSMNSSSNKLKKEEDIFSTKCIIKEMINDKKKHIQIIGIYWKWLDWVFENKKQYKAALGRDLRAASALGGYSLERIKRTFRKLDVDSNNGEKFAWNLNTVHKTIDNVK